MLGSKSGRLRLSVCVNTYIYLQFLLPFHRDITSFLQQIPWLQEAEVLAFPWTSFCLCCAKLCSKDDTNFYQQTSSSWCSLWLRHWIWLWISSKEEFFCPPGLDQAVHTVTMHVTHPLPVLLIVVLCNRNIFYLMHNLVKIWAWSVHY